MQPLELSKHSNPIDNPLYQSPPVQLPACSSNCKGISHKNKQKNNNWPLRRRLGPSCSWEMTKGLKVPQSHILSMMAWVSPSNWSAGLSESMQVIRWTERDRSLLTGTSHFPFHGSKVIWQEPKLSPHWESTAMLPVSCSSHHAQSASEDTNSHHTLHSCTTPPMMWVIAICTSVKSILYVIDTYRWMRMRENKGCIWPIWIPQCDHHGGEIKCSQELKKY